MKVFGPIGSIAYEWDAYWVAELGEWVLVREKKYATRGNQRVVILRPNDRFKAEFDMVEN